MADELVGIDALMALLSAKRSAMGLDADGAPAQAAPTSVDAELAKTENAVATRRLQTAMERVADDRGGLLCPVGPDLSVVDLVHRGHDGYIPLATKANGPWRELGCVPAKVLRGLFGARWLTEELDHDAYFSVHGMFGPAHYRHRSTLPQLSPSLRKAKHVRWLTACHVDLDTYNVGLDAEDGLAAVLRAARAGLVPPPSMFSLSRGCWAWWLLRDEDSRGPVNAWPEAVDKWSTIQGTLHQRLAKLGSDASTLHPATLTRLPGSYSTKARRRVAWQANFDDAGKPFVYTLQELADELGIELQRRRIIEHRPADDRPKDPSRIERGRRGYHSRWTRYMDVLDQLRRMRGGWRVGTRAKAVSLVAQGCVARGWHTERAMEELVRHLDGMQQPAGDELKPAQLKRVLKGTTKPKSGGVRWQTVADMLDVTPDESAVLSTAKSPIPPARRHDQLPAVKAVPPAVRQSRRRATLKDLLARVPDEDIPPTRILRELLLEAGHESATDKTLLKDLVAIGRPSPRRHKPHPKGTAQLRLPGQNGP